jgi:hypothetical protein
MTYAQLKQKKCFLIKLEGTETHILYPVHFLCK